MLEISPIKAFNDNYLWLFKPVGNDQAVIVDPGDATVVLDYLKEHKLALQAIFITHHHGDHTGGIEQLLQHFEVPVYGPDSANISSITHPLHDGDKVEMFGECFNVVEIPGHTMDHIAYYTTVDTCQQGPVLFCGDTLFAGGCGRVFEGTYAMMHQSLQKLATLSSATQVFCAHEYTMANLSFAAAVSPADAPLTQRIEMEQDKRDQGVPTLPTSIRQELATNPFFLCENAEVKASAEAHAGHTLARAEDVFATLRKWKDSF